MARPTSEGRISPRPTAANTSSIDDRAKRGSAPVGVGKNLSAIPIRGINSDLPIKFAPNGGAVPGDRIVGILNPGEGITIYPIQSPTLKDFEDTPERWLDVRWDVDESTPQRFPARIVVDNVNDVVDVATDTIRPAPDMGGSQTSEFIEGIATHDEQMLILLDAENLVSKQLSTTGLAA